jgi:hypothetical protein
MTENPPDGQEPLSIASTVLDTHKPRGRSFFHWSALPQSMFVHIGQIAVVWGEFENRVADYLVTVIKANGTEQKGQQFYSFEQKANWAKDETQKCFSCRPRIALRVISILDLALALQVKRNFILHGNIVLKIDVVEKEGKQAARASLVTTKRHKKQVVTNTYTDEEIEMLSYDIGELAGIMNDFMSPQGKWASLMISWQDRLFLQAFLSNSPPPHSIPAMRLLLPLSLSSK